jgi:apolipoprotein N-acyltransferase
VAIGLTNLGILPQWFALFSLAPILYILLEQQKFVPTVLFAFSFYFLLALITFVGLLDTNTYTPQLYIFISLLIASEYAVFGLVAWQIKRYNRLLGFVLLVSCWVLLEIFYGSFAVFGSLANPLVLGYQVPDLQMAQLASWGGVHFVSLVLLAINATLVYLLKNRNILLSAFTFGLIVLCAWRGDFSTRVDNQNLVKIAVFQPVITNAQRILGETSQKARMEVFSVYKSLLRATAPHNLSLWPEVAYPGIYSRFKPDLDMDGLIQNQRNVVFGALEDNLFSRSDSAILFNGKEYITSYQKRSLDLIDQRVARAGQDAGVFTVDGLQFGIAVCMDIIQAEIVRDLAKANTQAILALFNNESRLGMVAQLRAVQFRSIETNRYFVVANQFGMSSVVNNHGRIVDQLPWLERRSEVYTVPLIGTTTPFVRYGNLLCIIFVFVISLLTVLLQLKTLKNPKFYARLT